jgi:radical SAM-linked protein
MISPNDFSLHIRLHYSKTGALRYSSTLDMQLVWERTFRRAQLPLDYSHGFHPQPRIQQALPLPLGFLSEDEIMDVWLSAELVSIAIITALQKAVPPGIDISKLNVIIEKTASITTQVQSTLYSVIPLVEINELDLQKSIKDFLSKDSVTRELRKKVYDLRPLVEKCESKSLPGEKVEIQMQLSAREGANGRPDEVISSFGYNPMDFLYIRKKTILINSD